MNAITTVTGAQYTPMNTNPPAIVETSSTTPQSIVNQLSALLSQLVTLITSQQQPTHPTQTEDFKDTVETILENATWFDTKLEDLTEKAVSNHDMQSVIIDEINNRFGDELDNYMNNSFDINDHVNIGDRVRDELNECLSDEVSEVLDEVLESKVGECLDEILEDKIAEILSRRTITINF